MGLPSNERSAEEFRFRRTPGKSNSVDSTESAFPSFYMRGSPKKSKALTLRFRESIQTRLRRPHGQKQQKQKGRRVLCEWLSFGLWRFGIDRCELNITEPRGSAELVFKGPALQSPSLN